MKKILLPLLLMMSILNPIPAKANSCNIPYLSNAASDTKKLVLLMYKCYF
jgi:hypothetical protein